MNGNNGVVDTTRNVVSPLSDRTTPTMGPSSIHTSPKMVESPSPTSIIPMETILMKGAFSCIVQECANRVNTEFTVCSTCHGRATLMFQEMKKFSRPCAECKNPVFALTAQVQPSEVFCPQCITKKMPPPPGLPPSAPKTSRSIAPAPAPPQNVPVRSNSNGHRRTTSEQFVSRPRVVTEGFQIPHKRKASGGPHGAQHIPSPIRQTPPVPLNHQGVPMYQPGPALFINPISNAAHVVQPSGNPQMHPQIIQLREPQPFPWPPHQSFHELIGLPHLNARGEYIHPEVVRAGQTQQRRPEQRSRPKAEPQPSTPVTANTKLSPTPELTTSFEPSPSSSTPSRLSTLGLHRCNAPGCVTLIPNSNPAPYCKRCSTLDVYSPSQTPTPLPLSVDDAGESSNRRGSSVMSALELDSLINLSFPSSPTHFGSMMSAAGPSHSSSLFKADTPSSRQTSETDFPPSSLPSSSSPMTLPRGLSWESDVSDLTPLEDSSGEDDLSSSDEDEGPRPRLILRLPPRKLLNPTPPSDPKKPLDLTQIVLPDKWKLDPTKKTVCCVVGCQNLVRLMSRSPLRLCYRHNNAIKTHCKRHPPTAEGTPTEPQRQKRQCRGEGCTNELPPKAEHPWRACEDCRFRKQQAKVVKFGPLWEFLSNPYTSDFLRNPFVQEPSEKYPYYQDFAGLLESFEFCLMGFLVGQIQYIRHKLDGGEHHVPVKDVILMDDISVKKSATGSGGIPPHNDAKRSRTVFDFEGEYSIVADAAGGDVSKRIQSVRKAIEGILGCELSSGGLFVAPEGRIIGRFHCTHETTMQTSLSQPSSASHKDELESPDIPLASLPRFTSPEPMDIDLVPTLSASPPKQTSDENLEPTSPPSSDTALMSTDSPTQTAEDESLSSAVSSDTLINSPDSKEEPAVPPTEIIKRMSGELQVILAWDRRHRYFPGLRTVVRFKLVG